MSETRYKAFISYSHADEKDGDWLHRALETYRVPKYLVGSRTTIGDVPERLTPIFRDRDDLPAAGNLNATIIAALKSSEFLVVLASPSSAKSKWVNEEIRQFKKFHGPDRVLAVIVDGEPFATDNPHVDDSLECFPETLRFNETPSGDKTPAEPLAADARKGKDGKRYAITKLAAGLIGARLDDLIQREAQRRTQRAWALACVAAAAAAVLLGVASYAFVQREAAVIARAEAEDRRVEAEGLVDFMITDVREEVERDVGKLESLDSLADRAINYYAAQDLETLDADALGRRARVLLFSGSVEQQRNNLAAALSLYGQAAKTTEELLERDSNNSDRIFEHAQSVFYVGYVHRIRGETERARKYYTEYLEYAQRLIELEPDASRSQFEMAYATNNLGSIEFSKGAYDSAIDFFEQSVAARKNLFEASPRDARTADDYAYAISSVAYAEMARGKYSSAVKLIESQLDVYDQFTTGGAADFRFLDATVTAQRRLSNAHLALGDMTLAKAHLDEADQTVSRLLSNDPQNANWKLNASHIERSKSYLFALEGDSRRAIAAADEAIMHAEQLLEVGQSNSEAAVALALALSRRLLTGDSNQSTSQRLVEITEAMGNLGSDGPLRAKAVSAVALSELARNGGGDQDAMTIAEQTIRLLETNREKMAAMTHVWLLNLYLIADKTDRADATIGYLRDTDMNHPHYANLLTSTQN